MTTVGYYDDHADAFFRETVGADMSSVRRKFLSFLPPSGKILDAGCGSGRDVRAFAEAGFEVTAFDASKEMVLLASDYARQPILHLDFEEVPWVDEFDGIWACASLLHVPADRLVAVMGRLARALKANGILYGSFKYGQGEVERAGRRFTDLNEKGLSDLLAQQLGLALFETWVTSDVRPGRTDKWLNFLLRRTVINS